MYETKISTGIVENNYHNRQRILMEYPQTECLLDTSKYCIKTLLRNRFPSLTRTLEICSKKSSTKETR